MLWLAFWEEHEAGNAIAALKAKLANQGQGQTRWEVDQSLWLREVVPGDVIRLRLGDIVPADVRLLGRRSGRSGSVCN